MHQILRDNALFTGLYNSLYYRMQAVMTACTVVISELLLLLRRRVLASRIIYGLRCDCRVC